jgi:hypothetical protein
MKIITSRIKRWSFKQRLHEMRERLNFVSHLDGDIQNPIEEVEECLQILDYWMDHMAGEIEKPKKKKKDINLW